MGSSCRIADCCVQRRLKQEYRPISADKLVYPYETLELMSLVTNDQRFRQVRSSIGMKEDVTMYMILDKMMNESEAKGRLAGFTDGKIAGIAQGRREGELNLLFNLVKDGVISLKEGAFRAEMTEDQFRAQMLSMTH